MLSLNVISPSQALFSKLTAGAGDTKYATMMAMSYAAHVEGMITNSLDEHTKFKVRTRDAPLIRLDLT